MPTQLGLGLGIPLNQSTWFNSSAYADLAAIADFSNNQYALPALGPEAVTNGTFDTNLTGWLQTAGGWSWSGGKATLTGDGNPQSIYQPCLTVGSLYLIEFDVTASGGGGQIGFSNAGGGIIAQGSSGRVSAYWVADTVNLSFKRNTGTVNGTIDNVSVREVLLTRDGQALGANLLPGTGTNRSIGTGTANYSSGSLTLTGTDVSNSGNYEFPIVTEPGATYRVIFTASGASVWSGLWDGAGGQSVIGGTAASRTGFQVLEFKAVDASTYLVLSNVSTGGTATITGIEVRKLPATGAYPKRSATFAEWFAYTAASTTARSYVAADGTWKNDLAANAPRLDFRNSKRQLRLEDARTNIFANPMFTGAVAGVVGAGGVYPTGLGQGGKDAQLTTVTRTILGSGSYKGLPYFDIKYDVVVSSPGRFFDLFQSRSSLVLTAGVTYAWRFNVRALEMTGPAAPAIFWNVVHYTASDVLSGETGSPPVPLTGADQVIEVSITTPALTTKADVRWSVHFNSAGTYSLTLRIFGYQGEVGSFSSDFIFGTGPTTRDVETARFSPLLEAIMQRASASVVVRGRLDAVPVGAAPRVVGGNGGVSIIGGAGSGTIVGSYNGTTSISATVPSSGNIVSPFGTVAAFDSSGRTVGVNGALSGGDTATIGDRAQVLLARAVYIGGSSEYGHGLYDFVGISPERLPSATLQALAVPA